MNHVGFKAKLTINGVEVPVKDIDIVAMYPKPTKRNAVPKTRYDVQITANIDAIEKILAKRGQEMRDNIKPKCHACGK